jgi:hypothetical protein
MGMVLWVGVLALVVPPVWGLSYTSHLGYTPRQRAVDRAWEVGLAGMTPGGTVVRAPVGWDGALRVDVPLTGFGELRTASLEPVIQGSFVSGIHGQLWATHVLDGGTVTATSAPVVEVATNTDANGHANLHSRALLRYSPGVSDMVRFTVAFPDGGQAATTLYMGMGDETNGFFVGYQNTSFGVLHRTGGAYEVQSIQVTTAPTSSGDITVTLEGDDVVVAVTSAQDAEDAAASIAAADYTAAGGGWDARAEDDYVFFVRKHAGNVASNVISIAAGSTGMAFGSITEEVDGADPTDTFTASSSWNVDKGDGTGPSGYVMDFQYLQVCVFQLEWLGAGKVSFGLENTATGQVWVMHRWTFVNQQIVPSIATPSLPISAIATKTAAASGAGTSRRIISASVAGFTEGPRSGDGISFATSTSDVMVTANQECRVLSLHVNTLLNSKHHRTVVSLVSLSVAAIFGGSGRSTVRYHIYHQPNYDGVGMAFTPVHADSVCSYAQWANEVAYTPGGNDRLVYSTSLATTTSHYVDLQSLGLQQLQNGDRLLITCTSIESVKTKCSAALTWKEDF